MKGLIHYHFVNYSRTYKYIPPVSVFIIMLLLNYATIPNPIMYSYSFTSLMLFFIMGWFTITVLHAEDGVQKQITILHTKNKRKYYLALIINCVIIGLILSLIAVAYPIVFHSFGPKVQANHIVTGVLAHFSLAVLSISLSLFFTRDLVKTNINSWWGVTGILVVSLAMAVAQTKILTLKLLSWLLPPVRYVLEITMVDDKITQVPATVYIQFGWIFIYSLILMVIYIAIVSKRSII